MSRNTLHIASGLALAWLVSISNLQAATFSFEANLDGLQVVPPNTSPAFGLADGTYDDTTGNFTLSLGTYQDLLGGATFVTLSDAAAGANGPNISVLTLDTPAATTGTFSGGTALTAGQWADMQAGNTYIRIASQVFPTGEIRGQLFQTPEPSSVALMGLGALGL